MVTKVSQTPQLVDAPASSTPRRALRKRKRDWQGWAFVGPFMIVFALVLVAPILYSVYLSLTRTQLIGGTRFVWFDNYLKLVQDPLFWDGFGRILLFFIIQVPVMLLLALIAALAIDSARLRARGFYRIIIYVPYAVPAVVAAFMWGFMYGDRFGLVGDLNDWLGGGIPSPLSPQWIVLAIANIQTWSFTGYNMLIFYSVLRTIPAESYQAARLDGANEWWIIRGIKLPAIRSTIALTLVFSIIGSFQLFNEPNILKSIVPNVITTYFTPNMYAYNLSFSGQQYDYAATVALVMGAVTVVFALLVQRFGTPKDER